MPTLSPVKKEEVLARVKPFSTSGFKVRMYGNVCYYYQSFVGRDFKAVFILSPYLDDAQKKVLLSKRKFFGAFPRYTTMCCSVCFLHIPYCIHLDVPYCLLQLHYWGTKHLNGKGYVLTAKNCLPKLSMKPKVHLLHLVSCMQDFGPSSAFGAER